MVTPYGIDPSRIQANRPHRARLRWAARQAGDLLIALAALGGLLLIIKVIEGIPL